MILFGPSNILASFQGQINKILAKKLNVFVIVYLDDILIDIDEVDYVNIVWWIFNQLRKYLLYANLKKYSFHQEKLWFVGYMVFLQGICIENK